MRFRITGLSPEPFQHLSDAVLATHGVIRQRYDAHGMMLDADVVDGDAVEPLIDRLFADPAVQVIHVHHAKRGCHSGRIDRA